MPARSDCEKTLLLRQQARLQQLEKLLRESEIIEPGAQSFVLYKLSESGYVFRLEAEAQEQLRSGPPLNQLRQEYRLAFKVTTEPTQKLDQIEALWFSSPYVEARFQILRVWVCEVFRILVEVIWQGQATPKQLRGAGGKVVLALIEMEEKDFSNGIRSDVLTDCLAFQVEFPEEQFRVREQDFMRLTAKLAEKWKKDIKPLAWEAEQRTTAKEQQETTEREKAGKGNNRRTARQDTRKARIAEIKRDHPKRATDIRFICVKLDATKIPLPPESQWEGKSKQRTWAGNYDRSDTLPAVQRYVSEVKRASPKRKRHS